MKKIILSAGFILASIGATNAQEGLQLGANLGGTMGLSLKYEFRASHAIEGVFGYTLPVNGVALKAMYNYHIPLVDALSLYMGGGVNIGGYHIHKHHDGDFAFGLVPTVGLEYKIKTAPLNVAFGYEPSINFTSTNTWKDVALKLRYRF